MLRVSFVTMHAGEKTTLDARVQYTSLKKHHPDCSKDYILVWPCPDK